eukprot:snap_masked-scaffold_114-processed-gene-0.2-mRNA-1 protein AED:0.67 eAED:0.88 QI:0/0/0/1/1/1/2/0/59
MALTGNGELGFDSGGAEGGYIQEAAGQYLSIAGVWDTQEQLEGKSGASSRGNSSSSSVY